MVPSRRPALLAGLALLVVIAGCVSGAPRSNDPATTAANAPPTTAHETTATRSTTLAYRDAPTTPEPLAGRANCSDDLWVSFWGLGDPRLWNAHEVRYGTYVPPNGSYLYVAYVDGTVAGADARSMGAEEGGLHVDGGSIAIDDIEEGDHAVRIVVHRDGDGDGTFDGETDPPCYNDDGLVQSAYYVLDLSAHRGN